MSSARARLKSANEALSAERYADAVEIRQKLLSESPDNYNAIIFLGAAYEGLKRDDDALGCYRQATEAQPKQLLGWKAMAKYCESHHDRQLKQELPEVYNKVLELTEPTDAKHAETLTKLIELLCRQRQHRRAVDVGKLWLTRYTASDSRVRLQLQLLDAMEKASEGVPDEELFAQFESVLSLPDLALASGAASSAAVDQHQLQLRQLHDRHCDFLAKRGAEPERRLRALAAAVDQCPDDVECVDRLAFARAELGIVCDGWRLTRLAKHLAEVKVAGSAASDFGAQVVSPAVLGQLHEALAALASPRWSLPPAPIEAAAAVTAPSGSVVSALVGVLCAKATRRYADCSLALDNLQAVFNSVGQHRKICCITSGNRHLLDSWSRRVRYRCLACYADEQRLTAEQLEVMTAAASSEQFSDEDREDSAYWVTASLSIGLGRLGRLSEAQAAWPVKCGLTGRRVEAFLAFEAGDANRARDLLGKLLSLNAVEDEAVGGVGVVRRRPWDRLMTARCMWKLNQDPHEVAAQLHRCIEEDRYYPDAYYWYGCYAEDVTKNESLAREMYTSAHQLDGDHEAALKRLCDLLLRCHSEADCVRLLTEFAARFYRVAPWCYFKLGLAHLNIANYHLAIDCLQRVVHLDRTNPHAWTCLGEAYRLRGSFESAGKVFERVVKLAPSDWYSRLQLASVLHKQRQFLRAISLLNELLSEEEQDSAEGQDSEISLKLLAYKQLSESHLQLGTDLSSSGQHLSAAEHLALAANAACDAVHNNRKLVCVWKLLGDSLYRLSFYESALLGELPFSELLTQLIDSAIESATVSDSANHNVECCQSRVLQGCINAYGSRLQQALSVTVAAQLQEECTAAEGVPCQPQTTSLLESNARLDCAMVLLRVSRVSTASRWHDAPSAAAAAAASAVSGAGTATGCGKESQTLLEAMQHCQLALKLRPTRPDAWYIMGLIQAHRENRPMAQHCFIKSLELDPGQAEVWTALGLFYCQLDKLEHGAACFRKAVDADPTSAAAWSGCAVVARIEGKTSQVRDLLRHACSLTRPPLDATRGFVHCAALEITRHHSLTMYDSQLPSTAAIDALTRLAVEASESALHLAQSQWERLALLNHRLLCLERLQLIEGAANASLELFSLALDDMQLAESAGEAAAALESSLELRAIVSNCLRCLALAGRYDEVVGRADYLHTSLGGDLSAQDLCYIGFSVAKSSTRDAPDASDQLELASEFFYDAVERVPNKELAGSVWTTVMAAAEYLDNDATAASAMNSALELGQSDASVVRCVLAYVSLRQPKMVAPGLKMLRDLLPPETADSDPQIGLTEATEALTANNIVVAMETALRLTRCSADKSQAAGWIAALRTLSVLDRSRQQPVNNSLISLSSAALFDRCLHQLARIKAPSSNGSEFVGNYLDEVSSCLSASPSLRALCSVADSRVQASLKRICAALPSDPALGEIVKAVKACN